MDTNKHILSKANSLRFAHSNGLMPTFDNQLSSDENFGNKSTRVFEHTFFVNDKVLVQVKCGKDASSSHKLTKVYKDGTTDILGYDDATIYTDFNILDYLVDLNDIECFYILSEGGDDTWISENINVIESDIDQEYLLQEWTNLDPTNDSFEFDYTTTLAITNVNLMYVKGELLDYTAKSESTIYDNQNEIVKLKSNMYRVLNINLDILPRPVIEKIIIAMQHDVYQLNQVAYVAEEVPEVAMLGSWASLSAELTLVDSLGLNTHDIGFDCDSSGGEDMIENKVIIGASGSGSFTVSAGFGITQIIAVRLSGTPLLKIGESVLGDEIMTEQEVEDITPPLTITTNYTANTGTTWIIYYTLTSGLIDLYIQTMKFN